jgi:hypothetical protein
MHAPAVKLRQPFHLRQLVDHTGCEKELSAAEAQPSQALDHEPTGGSSGVDDPAAMKFHRWIPGYLFSRDTQKIRGRDAIAGEISVESAGPGIPGLSDVADEHTPPAATQHQGPAEPCRSSSYNKTVVRHVSYARPATGRAPTMTSPESMTCLKRRRSSATCFDGSSPSSFATATPTIPAGGS